MGDKIENALLELNQTIVILSNLDKKFNTPSKAKELTVYDLVHLHNRHYTDLVYVNVARAESAEL